MQKEIASKFVEKYDSSDGDKIIDKEFSVGIIANKFQ